jgi:hypothetical protein
MQNDTRAFGHEAPGHRRADTRGTAGNQDDLVAQSHIDQ